MSGIHHHQPHHHNHSQQDENYNNNFLNPKVVSEITEEENIDTVLSASASTPYIHVDQGLGEPFRDNNKNAKKNNNTNNLHIQVNSHPAHLRNSTSNLDSSVSTSKELVLFNNMYSYQ